MGCRLTVYPINRKNSKENAKFFPLTGKFITVNWKNQVNGVKLTESKFFYMKKMPLMG